MRINHIKLVQKVKVHDFRLAQSDILAHIYGETNCLHDKITINIISHCRVDYKKKNNTFDNVAK